MNVAVAPALFMTRSRFLYKCLHMTMAVVQVGRNVQPESCSS
jgi:hypothetical protein